ncbi:MAG TPA: ABC transporter substrate-binding protein [Candidatus Riflebacteria bacterium]|nr:ABC transporter substrate-binding protein [Candidatus Riflebacteria bacterium]
MESFEKAVTAGREVTDMTGRKVIVPEVIETVFAGSLYGYTMLGSLAPEMLVATPLPPRNCDKKFLHPNLHNLPVIEKITDTESLAKVKPDVVVVWADKEQPFHKKSEDVLNSLKIPFVYVIVGNLGDVQDYPAAFTFLGKLLGKEDRAAQLADYCQKTLSDVATVVQKVTARFRPGVYYAECEDGLATEYDDSLHAHPLKLLGDVNVHRGHMTEHKGMEKISLDQLVAYNPDVIIAWNRAFAQNILRDPAWASIRAVRDRRVYAIPNAPFNWFDRPPCFMRILGLKWLAHILYPKDYAIDLVKETQKFYALFLNSEITAEAAGRIITQDND